jgi:hypothetical protein
MLTEFADFGGIETRSISTNRITDVAGIPRR